MRKDVQERLSESRRQMLAALQQNDHGEYHRFGAYCNYAQQYGELEIFPKNRDWECWEDCKDRRIFNVDVALTEEEIGFLQQLVDSGEVGRTITGLRSRVGLLHWCN
jgi:hypothetical protein